MRRRLPPQKPEPQPKSSLEHYDCFGKHALTMLESELSKYRYDLAIEEISGVGVLHDMADQIRQDSLCVVISASASEFYVTYLLC